MNEAIKLAIEKGGYTPFPGKPYFEIGHGQVYFFAVKGNHEEAIIFEQILLDPLFWQSLGKALGWGNSDLYEDHLPPTRQTRAIPYWRLNAIQYFDLLLTGGDQEKFWKDILPPNI